MWPLTEGYGNSGSEAKEIADATYGNYARADAAVMGASISPAKAGLGAVTGAVVNGGVAALEGKPIAPAAANGAVSGATTAVTGAVVQGRNAKAAAVGVASAVATKATGGSDFDAGLAGAVSGTVEWATGNERLANGAALGFEGFAGDVSKAFSKKIVGSLIKEPAKSECKTVNGGSSC
jgi:hypothetical protein